MDNKNSKRQNFYYVQQACLDTKSLICCLIADYFLIQRGNVPFASALYYILSIGMNNEIYKQNLLSKKNKLDKEGKVIMTTAIKDNTNENNFQYGKTHNFDKAGLPIDECEIHSDDIKNEINTQSLINKENELNNESKDIMTNDGKDNTNEDNFQYGKAYYFDKSGLPIDGCEIHRIDSECKKIITTCCHIQTPRGFILTDCLPEMCFNLAGLFCIKSPIMQKVTLPACECEHPKQCEVVAGYEIRAVGEVNFSISLPIHPISGFCSTTHSHICCSSTVPVNKIISHTCCPKPCANNESCVDWNYAYYCVTPAEDNCGSYIVVNMGIALEYTGDCECDEE